MFSCSFGNSPPLSWELPQVKSKLREKKSLLWEKRKVSSTLPNVLPTLLPNSPLFYTPPHTLPPLLSLASTLILPNCSPSLSSHFYHFYFFHPCSSFSSHLPLLPPPLFPFRWREVVRRGGGKGRSGGCPQSGEVLLQK